MLRTPTFPWDEIEKWAQGLLACSAIEEGADVEAALNLDTATLRNRLRQIVSRPEMRAALYVASPGLNSRLGPWLYGDESAVALKVESAIVRYFMRMAGRATPFGLFAGTSVGVIGEHTDLQIPELSEQFRYTRVDMGYIHELIERFSNTAEILPELRFHATPASYEVGGRLRYYEKRMSKKLQTFHLVDVEPSPQLYVALDFASRSKGATMQEIAAAIVAAFKNVEISEAKEYVQELVDANLLCHSLTLAVTGREPISDLIVKLRTMQGGGSIANMLKNVLDDLEALDYEGFDVEPRRYEQIAVKLKSLYEDADATHFFRVDLHKPNKGLLLGKAITDEIRKGLEILANISPAQESPISNFARQFEQRYQGREVPLLEALDEETGIGFDVGDGKTSASPLVADVTFEKSSQDIIRWGHREEFLFGKLGEALQDGSSEIVLTELDIQELSTKKAVAYPPGLGVMASIGAHSHEGLGRGEYKIHLQKAVGATSGKLFGRFCQTDPELERHVRSALQKEESYDPRLIHAEIVHLPQGRVGNVICRPILREYEIPIFGGSSAPESSQIHLSDLLVSVVDREVQLRSAKHNRRVVPHLTCAHAFRKHGLSIYRFLASVEEQGLSPEFSFSWGSMRSAPFLPRVSFGKFILSLAKWNIPNSMLQMIYTLHGKQRFLAMQKLRYKIKLHRFVWLIEANNYLPVDFDNILSIESFLSASRQLDTITLSEIFPPPNELLVSGKEGGFHHEIIVPFVRRVSFPGAPPLVTLPGPPAVPSHRAKYPGSEWLFAKIYCGVTSLDRLLANPIPSLIRTLREDEAIDRWFFIRYSDPELHLRLRLRGDPTRLWQEVAPKIFAIVNCNRHLVQKVVIDTYDPETERYGGKEALDFGEKIFEADSEAALSIIKEFRANAEARWQLALLGMDGLLQDLGFSLVQKKDIVYTCRTELLSFYANESGLTRQIGNKYRRLRSNIETLFVSPRKEYAKGCEAICARSNVIVDLATHLRQIEAAGRMESPLTTVAGSYLHMWANRIFCDSANAQELVLYDFLHRLYDSWIHDNRGELSRRGE